MKIKGFTPAADTIIEEHGGVVALIYGAMWRFSRQSALDICTASQGKIGKRAGLQRETVNRNMKPMINAGLIKDTGKGPGGVNAYECLIDLNPIFTMGMTENHNQSDLESQSLVTTGHTKKDIKKESKNIISGMVELSGKPDKLQAFPPAHKDLVLPFCEFYRYPFPDEVKAWIKQVEVWVSRKYSTKMVKKACAYVAAVGWEYYQPASILKAFGKDVPTDNKVIEGQYRRAD